MRFIGPDLWCDRCRTYHYDLPPFDIEFIYLKASYKLAEGFDKYLEQKVMELVNETK